MSGLAFRVSGQHRSEDLPDQVGYFKCCEFRYIFCDICFCGVYKNVIFSIQWVSDIANDLTRWRD